MTGNNKGRISQIIGAVLDIRFAGGNLPEINEAIIIPRQDGTELTVEVSQHLGDDKGGNGRHEYHCNTGDDARHRHREGDLHKYVELIGAKILRSLDNAVVHLCKNGIDRQDHIWDIVIYHTENYRAGGVYHMYSRQADGC